MDLTPGEEQCHQESRAKGDAQQDDQGGSNFPEPQVEFNFFAVLQNQDYAQCTQDQSQDQVKVAFPLLRGRLVAHGCLFCQKLLHFWLRDQKISICGHHLPVRAVSFTECTFSASFLTF